MRQLARVLRAHAWVIMVCGTLAAAGAFVFARTLPKTYTASSSISVEGAGFAIPELQGALKQDVSPDPMPWVRTEVQALTARANVATVAKRLDLASRPEFNAAIRPPTIVEAAKARIGTWMREFLPGSTGQAPTPTTDELVVDAAMRAIGVFQDNRSLVIEVSFTSREPDLSAQFVNALVDNYEQTRAARRGDANAGASQVMTQRVEEVRADLAKIEQQMKELRDQNQMVTLRAGGVGQQQVEELTSALAKATLDRSQLEANYQRATAAASQGSSDELASVLSSPTTSRLREQAAEASQRVAELSTRYGPGYPGLRSANATLASAQHQLAAEAGRIIAALGAQLRVARQQEADIKQQLDTATHGAVQSENIRAQLDQLQQDANGRRALYQTLLERSQQTAGDAGGKGLPDVRVLSPAVAPGLPSGPNMKFATLMGGAGGVLFGCLVGMLRMRGSDQFEDPSELALATGLPVIATLPRALAQPMPPSKRDDMPARASEADALRALRSRLRMARSGGVPRVVLFMAAETGSRQADAAGAVAARFARMAADEGDRVLLIEGDLRPRRIGARLEATLGMRRSADADFALDDVLEAEDWRDAIVHDPRPGLDLLLPSRGQAQLRGMTFQNLLIEAQDDYDLVIIRAPEAAQADAATLAQRADVAVVVVDARSPRERPEVAISRLRAATRTPVASVFIARR